MVLRLNVRGWQPMGADEVDEVALDEAVLDEMTLDEVVGFCCR